MAPHLMRAQGAYKADEHAWPTHAHTHTNTPHTPTHTHTHTHHKNTSIVVMGLWKQKKESKKSVGRREEVGFQFWRERGEWRGMPNRERKRVPDDRSDILKGSLPKSPPADPWDTENLSIWGWTKRTRRRIEVKQLGEVRRSCSRNNVEAGESYFVLNPAVDRQPVEIKE